jgi:hypothetical protein
MVGSSRVVHLSMALALVVSPLLSPLAGTLVPRLLGLSSFVGAVVLGLPLSLVLALSLATLLLRRRPDVSSRRLWIFGGATVLSFFGLDVVARAQVFSGDASPEVVVALWLLSLGMATAAAVRQRQLARELRRART